MTLKTFNMHMNKCYNKTESARKNFIVEHTCPMSQKHILRAGLGENLNQFDVAYFSFDSFKSMLKFKLISIKII